VISDETFVRTHVKNGCSVTLTQEDFDIKKMTLNAVFAMQLHRFPDEVNELVVTDALRHCCSNRR